MPRLGGIWPCVAANPQWGAAGKAARATGRSPVDRRRRADRCARRELIGKLKAKSQEAARALSPCSTPDAELVLHAYNNWGEACVEHLLGDFSFAIWDHTRRHLFCARDHFGVKLLYYSRIGSSIVFSNTLNCLRQHPAASARLNDLAIADFLLFDSNQNLATTSFADIQRLPPAHRLTFEQGTVSTRRYWELSVITPIHYSQDGEYVERFRELLDAAVADPVAHGNRWRADERWIGFFNRCSQRSAYFPLAMEIQADCTPITAVFDSLIQDEERHYAKLVADALKIPIQFQPADEYRMFDRANHSGNAPPEPLHLPLAGAASDQLNQIAARSRVVFTGDGADPGLSKPESPVLPTTID